MSVLVYLPIFMNYSCIDDQVAKLYLPGQAWSGRRLSALHEITVSDLLLRCYLYTGDSDSKHGFILLAWQARTVLMVALSHVIYIFMMQMPTIHSSRNGSAHDAWNCLDLKSSRETLFHDAQSTWLCESSWDLQMHCVSLKIKSCRYFLSILSSHQRTLCIYWPQFTGSPHQRERCCAKNIQRGKFFLRSESSQCGAMCLVRSAAVITTI